MARCQYKRYARRTPPVCGRGCPTYLVDGLVSALNPRSGCCSKTPFGGPTLAVFPGGQGFRSAAMRQTETSRERPEQTVPFSVVGAPWVAERMSTYQIHDLRSLQGVRSTADCDMSYRSRDQRIVRNSEAAPRTMNTQPKIRAERPSRTRQPSTTQEPRGGAIPPRRTLTP